MSSAGSSGLKLGVNGFGRIGKLTVWHHVARKSFGEIVVNIGRQAGGSLEDIAHYVERDSTYVGSTVIFTAIWGSRLSASWMRIAVR